MRTHVCQDFWRWSMYLSLAVAALVALLVLRIVAREQLEWYRNRKRLAARGIVADEQTMEEAKWKGESGVDVELSEQELTERMREAIRVKAELEQRRADQSAAT